MITPCQAGLKCPFSAADEHDEPICSYPVIVIKGARVNIKGDEKFTPDNDQILDDMMTDQCPIIGSENDPLFKLLFGFEHHFKEAEQ